MQCTIHYTMYILVLLLVFVWLLMPIGPSFIGPSRSGDGNVGCLHHTVSGLVAELHAYLHLVPSVNPGLPMRNTHRCELGNQPTRRALQAATNARRDSVDATGVLQQVQHRLGRAFGRAAFQRVDARPASHLMVPSVTCSASFSSLFGAVGSFTC